MIWSLDFVRKLVFNNFNYQIIRFFCIAGQKKQLEGICDLIFHVLPFVTIAKQ